LAASGSANKTIRLRTASHERDSSSV
jgi:hypothetical protein